MSVYGPPAYINYYGERERRRRKRIAGDADAEAESSSSSDQSVGRSVGRSRGKPKLVECGGVTRYERLESQ